MKLFYCVKLYLACRAKSCDPQKYSGATHNIIYVRGQLYLLLYTVYEFATHVEI